MGKNQEGSVEKLQFPIPDKEMAIACVKSALYRLDEIERNAFGDDFERELNNAAEALNNAKSILEYGV